MPRKHRNLPDMMAELSAKFYPPVINYIFLNTYFFTETKPDSDISANFTIARLRHSVSINTTVNKYIKVITGQNSDSLV